MLTQETINGILSLPKQKTNLGGFVMATHLLDERTSRAMIALDDIHPMIEKLIKSERVKRPHLHICVFDRSEPWTLPTTDPEDLENCFEAFEESHLYSKTYGNPKDFEYDYIDISHGKAFITWRTGLPSRLVQTDARYKHLLREGDPIYWGSWIEQDIVVACSGVQPWYDEFISKTIAQHWAVQIEDEVEWSRERRVEEENAFFKSDEPIVHSSILPS